MAGEGQEWGHPAGSGAHSHWSTWQLLDSLLPTGAFAHSLGLEAALRHGFLLSCSSSSGLAPPPPGPPPPAPPAPCTASGSRAAGPPSASPTTGDAVLVFALHAGANVVSQLLPFVAAAHLCMAVGKGQNVACHPVVAQHPDREGGGGRCLRNESQARVSESLLAYQGQAPPSGTLVAYRAFARGIKATFLGREDLVDRSVDEGAGRSVDEGAGRSVDEGAGRSVGEGDESSVDEGSWGSAVEDPGYTWLMLDSILNAALTNHVARQASSAQGMALLRVATTITSATEEATPEHPEASRQLPPSAVLRDLKRRILRSQHQATAVRTGGVPTGHQATAVQAGGVRTFHQATAERAEDVSTGHEGEGEAVVPGAKGHHATVFGAVTALLHVPLETAVMAYLYSAMRDVLSAATRLNLIGPLEAAGLQGRLGREAEQMLQKSQVAQALRGFNGLRFTSGAPENAEALGGSIGLGFNSGAPENAEALGGSYGIGISSGVPENAEAVDLLSGLVAQAHVSCPVVDVLQGAHGALPVRLFLS